MTWVEWAMGIGLVSFGGAVFACAFFRGTRPHCISRENADAGFAERRPWCTGEAVIQTGGVWRCGPCWARVRKT